MPDLIRAAKALEQMAVVLGIETKSIDSVSRRFHAELRGLATIGFVGEGSILADVRQLVKQAIEDAYFEGLKEGGISPDEMDEEDAQNIVQLNLTQQDYITAFVRAIREARNDRTAQRDILDNRIDLWTASIAAAGQAGLNSAKANEMVIFDGPDGEESCADCQRYKHEAHRRKWFAGKNLLPATPGSALQCGGWMCQHRLASVR